MQQLQYLGSNVRVIVNTWKEEHRRIYTESSGGPRLGYIALDPNKNLDPDSSSCLGFIHFDRRRCLDQVISPCSLHYPRRSPPRLWPPRGLYPPSKYPAPNRTGTSYVRVFVSRLRSLRRQILHLNSCLQMILDFPFEFFERGGI